MSDTSPMLRPDTARPRRWAMLGAVSLLAAATAAVHNRAAWPVPDVVEAAETARRTAALAVLGPLPLPALPPADLAAALARTGLAGAAANALRLDVGAGRVRMALLTVFDSDQEDGDVAEISSAGFAQTVLLTKVPIVLAIPIGPDNMIGITGLVDGGGGGVTIGLVLPGGPVPLPPLSVGQIVRLPVGPVR